MFENLVIQQLKIDSLFINGLQALRQSSDLFSEFILGGKGLDICLEIQLYSNSGLTDFSFNGLQALRQSSDLYSEFILVGIWLDICLEI